VVAGVHVLSPGQKVTIYQDRLAAAAAAASAPAPAAPPSSPAAPAAAR
jgi:multidrug efflux system membrane fusion protein